MKKFKSSELISMQEDCTNGSHNGEVMEFLESLEAYKGNVSDMNGRASEEILIFKYRNKIYGALYLRYPNECFNIVPDKDGMIACKEMKTTVSYSWK